MTMKRTTMHRILSVIPLTIALPVALHAADFETLDANGDGYVSMAEFQEGMPGQSADAFLAADTDADGALSPEEVRAAKAEGILPSSEG